MHIMPSEIEGMNFTRLLYYNEWYEVQDRELARAAPKREAGIES